MSTLRAVGWDHPRCKAPAIAGGAAWSAKTSHNVEWTFRSLADFNAAPLTMLAAEFDLLVIDHPMVAASSNLLIPLQRSAGRTGPNDTSAGRSMSSYEWEGSIWAYPIDAAAHVSAAREDLITALGHRVPHTWAQVLELARREPGLVIASLTGDDAFCTLLTISASIGQPVSVFSPPSAEAVDVLVRLHEAVPDYCRWLRPPEILELLITGSAAYSPALFGYSSYLPASHGSLKYGLVPTGLDGVSRGILGGAGLAVSRQSTLVSTATAFCEWMASPQTQREVLVPAGGQPAAADVWSDEGCDRIAGGFFSQTKEAMSCSFTRPQHKRWSEFQHHGATILDSALEEATSVDLLTDQLAAAHAHHLAPTPKEMTLPQ